MEENNELQPIEVAVPKKVTAEHRTKSQQLRAEHSTTILQRLEAKVDTVLSNGDALGGATAASLFVLAGSYFDAGDWKNGCIFLGLALFLNLIKHRLPDGPISRWLKKSAVSMIEDVKKTLTGR